MGDRAEHSVPGLEHYPSPAEVDAFAAALVERARRVRWEAVPSEHPVHTHQYGVRHAPGVSYVEFSRDGGHRFHALWQPAPSSPAPLLVHLPGYGHEMSAHPELVAQGYNVLHVSPLGYASPTGPDLERMRDGIWPVLPETIDTDGEGGYAEWFVDCLVAIEWALDHQSVARGRVSLFGTSQGGGAALLLGSLLGPDPVRCVAADEPFLTHFPLAHSRGAYALADEARGLLADPVRAWKVLGRFDTLSHAHRLTMPVLLTAGGADLTCPPETIEALFERLPGTRSLTWLDGVGHGYTPQFVHLAAAWFRLYA